ncbi:MAG: hypothetical protein ACXQTI_05850 [Candidatus Nezhaarchaeales archaeon]
MSEECSDYIDCRQAIKRLLDKPGVKVKVTRHALNRVIERCSSRIKKLNESVVLDIIRNVIRDGLYKAYTQTILVWTSSYLLACTLDRELNIIVKTVMTRNNLTDEVRARLKKGIKAKWSKIIVES